MIGTDQPDPDLRDLAYPYAMDAVTETERSDIERLLGRVDRATAAEFAAEVRGIRELLASMTVGDVLKPPVTLEHKVLRALDIMNDVADTPKHSGVRRLRRGRMWRPDLLAAAVVLIIAMVVGGVVLVNRVSSNEPDAVTAQLIDQQPDVTIRSTPVAGGGTLRVHSSARLSAAAVSFDGVPELPSDRDYQLWLVPPAGQPPRSAAVVDRSSAQGTVLVTRFDPVDALAMTVEPAGGSAQPTTTPIVVLELAQ
ncbi:anti-sigma factor [Nocardia sp. NPDC051463]|uniref:anti-sigma factor n=1 Tax=Nocardia sp. NPDC051463 TaxID=3154845 RepID=UPI0034503777